jgi:hypothetical protein
MPASGPGPGKLRAGFWLATQIRAGIDLRLLSGVGVDDLDATVAFFTELVMGLEGRGQIEGLWADRTVGFDGVRSDAAMMRTPDGQASWS